MEINLSIDLTAQEIICWVALFLMAYYPPEPMVEAVGFKTPLLLLVSGVTGSGIEKIKNLLRGDSNA